MSIDFGSKNTQATIASVNYKDKQKVSLFDSHDGQKAPSNLLVRILD